VKKLTPKQQRFADEYLVDLNATQAAIRAGYSKKTAGQQGERLLRNVEIQEAVSKRQRKIQEKTEITQERVLAELSKLAFSNLADFFTVQPDGTAYVDLSELTREQAAALTEIQVDEYTEGRGEECREVKKVKIKVADKTKNLELIGKFLGMFKDRIEHTGADGAPIGVIVVPAKQGAGDGGA